MPRGSGWGSYLRAAFSGASGANLKIQVASSPAEATNAPPFLISKVTLNDSPRVVLRIRVCASSSESLADFDSTTTSKRHTNQAHAQFSVYGDRRAGTAYHRHSPSRI